MHIAAGTIVLNLKAGQIPVTFGDDGGEKNIYWMKQIEPVFGRIFSAAVMAKVLGLAVGDIDDRFPVEEVSTGLPAIIVPLRNLEALKRTRVDKDKYFALIKDTWAKTIGIFCPEPHKPENNISVRMFGDYYGVPEDPATGSGNGCLAAYLVHRRYWRQNKIDIRAEQGYEIGRPSLLFLKAEEIDRIINVSVGGKAITIAKGEFV
jgi:trans-2,3-dihydro-3-hydroxyanthranilate isomerase